MIFMLNSECKVNKIPCHKLSGEKMSSNVLKCLEMSFYRINSFNNLWSY